MLEKALCIRLRICSKTEAQQLWEDRYRKKGLAAG
jgi:hypothetical protein